MQLPAALTPHSVTVRHKTGDGAYGPVHAEPVTVSRCQVDERTTLVRDSSGAEVVSSTTVRVRPGYGSAPAGSLVTLPSGREATILGVAHFHHPPAPEFFEWSLT